MRVLSFGIFKNWFMEKIMYDSGNEPLVTSKVTFDILLKEDSPADLIALYHFYYYTAKWQKTMRVKATTLYVAKGLKWTKKRVQKNKKILESLGFIDSLISRNDNNTAISAHYINVHLIWQTNGSGNVPGSEPSPVAHRPTNALKKKSYNKKEVLFEKNYITPKLFEHFWELYPKKTDKGKALTSWEKLCKKENRPEWAEIRTAIKLQIKTPRWQNPKFIPLPTTWLNNSRWLDDPTEMTGDYDNKPVQKTGYTTKTTLNYKKPVQV